MTQSHEDGRSNAAATGAVIGGAALLLAGLFLKLKGKRAADEDSPILIKGGSLSVALHDQAGLSVNQGTDYAYTITGGVLNRSWQVAVAKLEAGFPVSPVVTYPHVSKLTLTLLKDDEDLLDKITVTFSPGVLTFTAAQDDHFGRNVRVRTVKKSYKHKKRAFHRKVRNEDDFEIADITVVSDGIEYPLPGSPDYSLAFDFTK